MMGLLVALLGLLNASVGLSGLMVTAIVGGACLPPLMGLVADRSSVRLGFLVPLAAILYITWTALINLKPARV